MKDEHNPYSYRIVGLGILLGVIALMPLALGQSGGGSPAMRGTEYDLTWHTVDGGGVMFSTGGDFELSDTAGHAMKVTDYTKAQGAIIGKAMTSLETGKSLVLVLVSLQ